MKKINVLFLGTSFEKGSGSDEVGLQIYRELIKNKNYNCRILSYYKNDGKFFSLNSKESKNFFMRIFIIISNINKLYTYCKNNNIKYIISLGDFLNFYCILTNFFLKIKIISTIHIDLKPFLKNKIKKFSLFYLYKKSYKIVCVSKGLEDYFISNNFKNTTTIYNGFNFDDIKKLEKEKILKEEEEIFNKKKFNFISIGRLSPQKGTTHLFRAFKFFLTKYKNSNLIILGWGEKDKNYNDLLKKLNLEKNVFLLGVKNNIFPYLKKADCFVFPSNFEGFGLVLVEALSQKKIIISSDCKYGPREILNKKYLKYNKEYKYPYFGDYGILVKMNKNNEVFNNLIKEKLNLEELELFQSMEEVYLNFNKYNCKKFNIEKFNIQKIIKEWERLLS
jgi:glycosyltransferase involved in cell wall biosynthesis